MFLALLLLAQTLDGPGSYAVSSALDSRLALPSGEVVADLYWPTNASRPAPVVVVGHGFARTKAALTNWGAHLASHGFAVAVPSFPRPLTPDHVANATRMLEIVAHLHATPGPIEAAIDPSKSALVGHSAGGLSALLAAADADAREPSIAAVVGLDPVDANGLGAGRVASITRPVLVLAADPSGCNANGSAAELFGGIGAAGSWSLHVAGSTHCDGEDPSNGTCVAFCGGEDPSRRALYRRYATAHLLAQSFCEGLDHLPGGDGLARDLAAGTVDSLEELERLPCTPPPPPADGGIEGGDAAASPDAGTGRADREAEGCGCGVAGRESRAGSPLLLVLAVAACAGRRSARAAGVD